MSKMTFNAEVVRWVDGDTVDVNIDVGFSIWSKQRIRLARVNTPEKGDDLYPESVKRVNEVVPSNSKVVLITSGKDRYGRYIGEVVLEKINVSDVLLHEGLAKPYKEK